MSNEVLADVRQRFEPFHQEPYPNNSPVLLLFDHDRGWIVEAVNNGEYEQEQIEEQHLYCQNLDFQGQWQLAVSVAKERGVRVRYYPRANVA